MKIRAKATSWTVAAAAAALFVAGCAQDAADSGGGETAEVQCFGVNACAGHSACATADSACAGQNACKGQGWVSMPADSCDAMGGTVG